MTPFQPDVGLIVVHAEVWGPKGGVAVQLALDTGATDTVINLGMLIGLGHGPSTSGRNVPITTGSGVTSAPMVVLSKIIALGHERTDFAVLGYTLPPSAGVDGVLGLDFLRGLHLSVDFRAGEITLG